MECVDLSDDDDVFITQTPRVGAQVVHVDNEEESDVDVTGLDDEVYFGERFVSSTPVKHVEEVQREESDSGLFISMDLPHSSLGDSVREQSQFSELFESPSGVVARVNSVSTQEIL